MMKYAQIPVALLLLVAAALKCEELAVSLESNRLLSGLQVVVEISVAVWLMSGYRQKAAQTVGQGMVLIFLFAASSKLLSGAESCGCFGRMEVSPIVTAALDFVSLILLTFWTINDHCQAHGKVRLSLAIIAAATLSGVSLNYIYSFGPVDFDSFGEYLPENRTIVLRPEEWKGRSLPIMDFIEDSSELAAGEWAVVLYHADCKQCEQLLSKSDEISGNVKLAFVEVPPHKMPRMKNRGDLRWHTLDDTYSWFVQTPALFRLHNGRVSICGAKSLEGVFK